MSDLARLLMNSVDVASEEENRREFKTGDFRWGETKTGDAFSTWRKPKVFVNREKLLEGGAQGDFEKKMLLSESLHNLKNVLPKEYQELERAALADPKYMRNATEAYGMAILEAKARGDKENRDFMQWHRESRFDQVIGGYLFAGDPDIPTLSKWSREAPYFKGEFKEKLEKLGERLGIKNER